MNTTTRPSKAAMDAYEEILGLHIESGGTATADDMAAIIDRHFDAQPEHPEQPATDPPQPVQRKAREWDCWASPNGSLATGNLVNGSGWNPVRVKEAIPGDDLLEQAVRQRDEAVGHLRAVPHPHSAMDERSDAGMWLTMNFPAPEPAVAWIPEVGEMCQVSGANMDLEVGRAFVEVKVLVYDDNRTFGVFQKPGCWPFVEKMENCTFKHPTNREQNQ